MATYKNRNLEILLSLALIASTLPHIEANSAAQIKKVQIGVKVGESGILVLKRGQKKQLNCKTKPKKAKNQLVYKSSKPTIIRVNKKGVVKALKGRGSAKITVSSKAAPKKKASITVKAGTPIRNIRIEDTATVKWTSANWILKEENGVLRKHYETFEVNLSPYEGKFHVTQTRTLILSASVTPSNATSKNLKWTANKSDKYVSFVPKGSTCIVYIRGVQAYDDYDITITATTTDGSNKKSSTTIRVLLPTTGPCYIPETPEPTIVPTTEPPTTTPSSTPTTIPSPTPDTTLPANTVVYDMADEAGVNPETGINSNYDKS